MSHEEAVLLQANSNDPFTAVRWRSFRPYSLNRFLHQHDLAWVHMPIRPQKMFDIFICYGTVTHGKPL